MKRNDPGPSHQSPCGSSGGATGSVCPPPRRRLQPSEKQLTQQARASAQTQRQRSFSSNSSQTIMAGLYDLEETLGKGHFATVKAAKHVFTGERVAVKVIDKTKLDSISQKALLKEVLCMKLVQHPNVVKLYEVIDTSSKMYLVLELGQGDLYDLILRQQGGLPEPEARVYFTQILTAVSYCHKLHVAHRDLKPENVVFFPPTPPSSKRPTPDPPTQFSKLGQVKLTDFGFSNKFCPGVNLDTSCGSLAYSAPEILLGDSYDAPAVDIWSLGVILYMLACGRAPFQEANDSETLTMIMDVKYSIPDNLSGELKDLIRRMLVRDPRRRANLHEIENHEWVKEGEGVDREVAVAQALPLIASNSLSECESERIFSEMVKGGIVSSVEEVKGSLRTNAYNHITSTYYLLAERLLREKTRRIRTPTSSDQPITPTSPTTSSTRNTPSSNNTPAQSPPTSPPIRIRKNSHQFEDVVLPSSISTTDPPKPPKQQHERSSIGALDLDTTNQQKRSFACLPVLDADESEENESSYRSRNSSPHHPHYYHHTRKSRQSPEERETERSTSPPKYCNPRPRIKPHHSHSDSSDEGGGTPGGGGNPGTSSSSHHHPTINIVLSEEKQESPGSSSPPSNSSSTHHHHHHIRVNNNVLKPSPSYEGMLDEDEKGGTSSGKRGKKKRVLFLSWFFRKSGDKGKSNRNIYKTKSCSELKNRSVVELDLNTRECFGVCNGSVSK